jgi:hypothetical protein
MSKPNKAVGAKLHSQAALALAIVGAMLTGCDEYLDRRDTISYGIGDSVAVNRSTQTIERWPNASRYDRWATDGERSRLAIEKYRKREVKIEKLESGAAASAATTSTGP